MSKRICIILICIAVGIGLYLQSPTLKSMTPEKVRHFLLQFGCLAPLVYILLFTIVPLTLFPDAILAIASGLVFGAVNGFLYTMIGAICGGTLAFFLARQLGKKHLAPTIEKHRQLHGAIESKGFSMILTMRLIPLIPFDIISYLSGASGIPFKSFISATFWGIIPGVALLVNIGAGMNEMNSPRLYLSLTAFILLILIAKHKKTRQLLS